MLFHSLEYSALEYSLLIIIACCLVFDWGLFIFNQNSRTVAYGPLVVYQSLFSYYNGPMGCMMVSHDLVPDSKCH